MIGAGPAGATTAYRLARRGASVALLDRARFPRDKPCGGGVTVRAARLLPFPLDPVVEDEVDVVEMRLGHRTREHRCTSPVVLMTQRRRLDAYLVERAAEAGARVRDGVRVTGVDGDTVRTDRGDLAATAIVGADGVNGVSRRALDLAASPAYGVALEADIPDVGRFRRRMLFQLRVVAGGYGWVFPKADHVNVGVGGWEGRARGLPALLRRFCAENGLPDDRLENVRGYRLPVARPGAVLARGRALVVGDAAGLVDPLSGDGIYEAFVSASLAADAVVDLLEGRAADLEAYDGAVKGAVARQLANSWAAQRALDRFPRLLFAIASTDPLQRTLERLARGDAHPPLARRVGRPALLALGTLARRFRSEPSLSSPA